MKPLLRIAIGGLVLAAAATLAVSDNANGFTTIGGQLGLNQRDFRLYDNFPQSRLHNNTAADSNWPGYNEVELSFWKGGAEWGSLAFGNGTGDPTQGVVGSGGANFDFFWSGNAGGIGNTNDNIGSMIGGSNGGVLAYTETPISDGWRIRFYENWNWFDGPGSESGIDLQGVACHELGHALGLGHTSTNGATMYASISGNGTAQRSIATDDINGVQFIYGAAGAGGVKPTITSLSGDTSTGGTVVVTGTGFSSVENEVWLNSSGTGGDPVKVLHLNSNGTQISFTMPNGVESGGIHVKKNNTGGVALSEGHPLDAAGGPPTQDYFLLDGPTTAITGGIVTYTITGAPGSSPFWVYYSKQLNGTSINGQVFDIGPNLKTLGTGTTSGTGTGSASSPPIPNRYAGRTAYLEARVDSGGLTLDSNYIQLDILF